MLRQLMASLNERLTALVEIHQSQLETFVQIEYHLSQIVAAANPAPNYRKSIKAFANFDWQLIGATMVKSDQHGATVVEWNGRLFTRRSPSNKYEPAIWFSRASGKDDLGNNKYEKLITFKDAMDAEELPRKVAAKMSASYKEQ